MVPTPAASISTTPIPKCSFHIEWRPTAAWPRSWRSALYGRLGAKTTASALPSSPPSESASPLSRGLTKNLRLAKGTAVKGTTVVEQRVSIFAATPTIGADGEANDKRRGRGVSLPVHAMLARGFKATKADAAGAFGDVDAAETQFCRRADRVAGEDVFFVPLGGVRGDRVGGEAAREFLDFALVVGEVELGHDGLSILYFPSC